MPADWSLLPRDLLRRLGDDLLDAGDIDYYMGMRAVCYGWRSALAKPRPLGVGADPRFRPRNWVMLHEKQFQEAADGPRLFVNVSTGRFLRRRVPMLDDHQLLEVSDCLLVLNEKKSPRTICVLEPFTGSVLRTPYQDEEEHDGDNEDGGHEDEGDHDGDNEDGSHEDEDDHDGDNEDDDEDYYFVPHIVYFVPDPANELRVVQFPQYSEDREAFYVRSMLAHAGHVYVADTEGCVFRIVEAERPSFGYGELIGKMEPYAHVYLVESGGELLVVSLPSYSHGRRAAQVYRVDVDRMVLDPLECIGSRALFLGVSRCLSVDADKFPSINRNCIYIEDMHLGGEVLMYHAMYMYDLSTDGMREHVSDDLISPLTLIAPLSLAKVFLDYCNRLADK